MMQSTCTRKSPQDMKARKRFLLTGASTMPEDSCKLQLTDSTVANMFAIDAREKADLAIVKCLYAYGLGFNVVEHLEWLAMVSTISTIDSFYVCLRRERIRSSCLDKVFKQVETSLKPIIAIWDGTGVSIITDGWKGRSFQLLTNFMCVALTGPMFWKPIDCLDYVKTGQYLANQLLEVIEEVGAHCVVKLVTNTAKQL